LDPLLDIKMCLYESDDEGRTVLHMAALAGQHEIVKRLLNSGAGIYIRDRTGMTVLHYAAVGGSVVVMKFLLNSGIKGRTVLYLALSQGVIRLGSCGVAGFEVPTRTNWIDNQQKEKGEKEKTNPVTQQERNIHQKDLVLITGNLSLGLAT
jgi:ankyrin repeat protein